VKPAVPYLIDRGGRDLRGHFQYLQLGAGTDKMLGKWPVYSRRQVGLFDDGRQTDRVRGNEDNAAFRSGWSQRALQEPQSLARKRAPMRGAVQYIV